MTHADAGTGLCCFPCGVEGRRLVEADAQINRLTAGTLPEHIVCVAGTQWSLRNDIGIDGSKLVLFPQLVGTCG